MKPRIKMVDGWWRVVSPFNWLTDVTKFQRAQDWCRRMNMRQTMLDFTFGLLDIEK